ncbi:MAG: nitrilase-related carbon-nitrogen hydrolase, partial [Verrucomicrobiota bacterium]
MRLAVCIPHVRVADPVFNVGEIIDLATQASEMGAAVALFPELGISAYSNEDLFHQEALLQASLEGLKRVVQASESLNPVLL